MNLEVEHDASARRFIAKTDGYTSFLSYVALDDKTLDYNHTFVPGELRGRGIASRLVKHALQYAKDRELKVVPSCPFVARIMQRDATFSDLAVKQGPGVDKSVENPYRPKR